MDGVMENAYKRGYAIGKADIYTDTIFFRFRNECFSFPSARVMPFTRTEGHLYKAPIAKLRELERQCAAELEELHRG